MRWECSPCSRTTALCLVLCEAGCHVVVSPQHARNPGVKSHRCEHVCREMAVHDLDSLARSFKDAEEEEVGLIFPLLVLP